MRRKILIITIAMVVMMLASTGRASGLESGKGWVREVLVQIGPGPDTLGGRVPGAWHGIKGAQIAVTPDKAFSGKNSLKVQLVREEGGCWRITSLPPGKGKLLLSCRVFVPEGQKFRALPAVGIWRGRGELVVRAEPINQIGKWTENRLELERPRGNPFYFGIAASAKGAEKPYFYVDAFELRLEGGRNMLENADFELDASDKRAQLMEDFNPDLINVWWASALNRDGFFTSHGVRIASWGKVEYDAAIDWDKRLDEFKAKAAKRDINGNIFTRPEHPPFTYRMCHHSPVWHEYQKSGLTSIVAENDALGQDNICNPSFRARDVCFCEYCERDFREHLKRRFSDEELSRLLPCPVEKFSIAQYVKSICPTHQGEKILDDAVAREFILSQYLYGKRFLADIADAIDREAAKLGKAVPFFGNQGSPWGGNRMPPYSVVISDIVDAQCMEVFLFQPYREPRRHAWGALQYKLMRAATGNRKPVWSLLPQGEPRLFPTGAYLHVAEVLSNGAVPILIWSAMSYPSKHLYDAHRTFARFLNENRALYLDRKPVARVGLVYSVPTSFWRYFPSYRLMGGRHDMWIAGVARVLEDAHIPYEVVVFGHPDLLPDGERLNAIKNYDALILTAVDCMSDEQAEALRKFVERGGRLIVIGEFGTRTENYQPRARSFLDEWKKVGAIAELPDSLIRDFMNVKADKAAVEKAYSTIRDAVERSVRVSLIRTNAPPTLWMTLWRSADGRRFSLHMVNYNVDLKRSAFRSIRDFDIELRVPRELRLNTVQLLTPNEEARDLPFERKGDAVSFRVPSVECYAVVVLTAKGELRAANLIARVRRNLARARVAARGKKLADEDVRRLLDNAERLYRDGSYDEAAEQARLALKKSRQLLTKGTD